MVWTPAFQAVPEDHARRLLEEVTAKNDRLVDLQCEAEDAWIAAPAPDVTAVITKIEYARRRWEDCTDWLDAWWNTVLADLRRPGSAA